MPARLERACSVFGCGQSVPCTVHGPPAGAFLSPADRRVYDAGRGSSAARGYGARWRWARRLYLEGHPICVACLELGRRTRATVVDHVVPHGGDMVAFWREDNWQALCAGCHAAKTLREAGRGRR